MRGTSLDADVGEAHGVMPATYAVSRFRSSGILVTSPSRTSTPFSACLSLVHFPERILLGCSSSRPRPAHQTTALCGRLTFATCVPKPAVEHAAGPNTESAFEQDITIISRPIEDPRGGIPHKHVLESGVVIVKTALPKSHPRP